MASVPNAIERDSDGFEDVLPAGRHVQPLGVVHQRGVPALRLHKGAELRQRQAVSQGGAGPGPGLPQADTDADMRDWFAREAKGDYDAAETLPVVDPEEDDRPGTRIRRESD